MEGQGFAEGLYVQFVQEKIVNDYRESVGCHPLSWDDRLASVATAHSEDMRQRKYISLPPSFEPQIGVNLKPVNILD